MKQLISLLLIVTITVISWSSYAKNTEIRVNYSKSSTAISSMVLKPASSEQHINENFGFVLNQATNKHNDFFELAIIFNEKLQQFIAFFTHFDDEVEETASNSLPSVDVAPSNNSLSTIQKCKASS